MLLSMEHQTDAPDDFDDYATSVASRRAARGDQTAQQHRAEAIEVLRDIVDDPLAKPQDRRQAASDLAKLTADTVAAGPRTLFQYSDEELLAFVAQARAERTGTPPPGVPVPQKDPFPFDNDDPGARLAAMFAQDDLPISREPLPFWRDLAS